MYYKIVRKFVRSFELTLADVGVVEENAVRPVEARLAPVAVDALGVVPAFLADATSLVPAVNVQRLLACVHICFVFAFVTVPEAVAS